MTPMILGAEIAAYQAAQPRPGGEGDQLPAQESAECRLGDRPEFNQLRGQLLKARREGARDRATWPCHVANERARRALQRLKFPSHRDCLAPCANRRGEESAMG